MVDNVIVLVTRDVAETTKLGEEVELVSVKDGEFELVGTAGPDGSVNRYTLVRTGRPLTADEGGEHPDRLHIAPETGQEPGETAGRGCHQGQLTPKAPRGT